MDEAIKFWKARKKVNHADFESLTTHERVLAFSVPGLKKGKELNSIFRAIQNALERGTTVRQFKKDCADIFPKIGWVGERERMADDFFNTNIQLSYSVGNYKQLVESLDYLPFWRYSAITDSRTRPSHLAMNGRVFPANHPVWDVWFPPNGVSCRCSVIGMTEKQVGREGLTVCTSTDSIGLPDDGFALNPGKIFYGE